MREHFQHDSRDLRREFQDNDPLQAELLVLLASNDTGETRWREVEPVPGKLSLSAIRNSDLSVQAGGRRHLCGTS